MILTASMIQQNAKAPLLIFRSIPTEAWSEEHQRFFIHLKTDINALSGMGFFIVTKSTLFAMTGVLITYKLVLFQFHGSDQIDWDNFVDCKKTFGLSFNSESSFF